MTKKTVINQTGQTFIEFMLLLIVVIGISYTISNIVNGNIAELWEYFANLVIDDPSNRVNL